MKKGILVVISGPSGTGKGTICNRILSEMDNIEFSTSMTTRDPREGEIDGVHYFFVTKDEFEKAISEDAFVEYADVYGNYYGTLRKEVNARLDSGTDVLLDIDVQGAMNVMKDYPKETFIFIRPPSLEELEKRLKGRGTDSAEVISRRLSEAEHEISLADEYGYQVVNDDLDEAVAEVKKIICEEHDKKAR
jgi:guanylate kinase